MSRLAEETAVPCCGCAINCEPACVLTVCACGGGLSRFSNRTCMLSPEPLPQGIPLFSKKSRSLRRTKFVVPAILFGVMSSLKRTSKFSFFSPSVVHSVTKVSTSSLWKSEDDIRCLPLCRTFGQRRKQKFWMHRARRAPFRYSPASVCLPSRKMRP